MSGAADRRATGFLLFFGFLAREREDDWRTSSDLLAGGHHRSKTRKQKTIEQR